MRDIRQALVPPIPMVSTGTHPKGPSIMERVTGYIFRAKVGVPGLR